jgi:hypothetical protein
VRVEIAHVDVDRRELDYRLVQKKESAEERRPAKKPSTPRRKVKRGAK